MQTYVSGIYGIWCGAANKRIVHKLARNYKIPVFFIQTIFDWTKYNGINMDYCIQYKE